MGRCEGLTMQDSEGSGESARQRELHEHDVTCHWRGIGGLSIQTPAAVVMLMQVTLGFVDVDLVARLRYQTLSKQPRDLRVVLSTYAVSDRLSAHAFQAHVEPKIEMISRLPGLRLSLLSIILIVQHLRATVFLQRV